MVNKLHLVHCVIGAKKKTDRPREKNEFIYLFSNVSAAVVFTYLYFEILFSFLVHIVHHTVWFYSILRTGQCQNG